ncbi:MAG: hypothetical protein ABEI99_03395 [Halobaculum sp.]
MPTESHGETAMVRLDRRQLLGSIATAGVFGGAVGTASGAQPEASISLPDQTRGRGAGGARIRVDEVETDDGGFVVIHNDLLLEIDPSDSNKRNLRRVVNSIVGVSSFLDAGTQRNVIVSLRPDRVRDGEQTLIAMPHRDTNGNGEYDFEEPPVAGNDVPYWNDPDDPGPGFLGGSGPVVDPATVRLVDGQGDERGRGRGADRRE